MLRKVYLEITNVCNLSCAFCPGTQRAPHFLTEAEFEQLAGRLAGKAEYLYFHLMGEPLLHPSLAYFLRRAGELGFRVILTSNGTLLPEREALLLDAPALHKVNLSLQSFEANAGGELEAYLSAFPKPWGRSREGWKLKKNVWLEPGEHFDWPDLNAPDRGERCFCYALRDQIGVLCDGTVVPCCLDHEGDLALGNLFEQELDEILSSARAQAIREGFSRRRAVEPLCRRCGFSRRF